MFAAVIAFAAAAAAAYGIGTSLQHRAASGVPREGVSAVGLLLRLTRRPAWLLGICLSGLAFVLHVMALHFGSLAVVQPVVVGTIVFAVLSRDALDRRWPVKQEVGWALCTWVGLALFVTMAHAPRVPHPAHDRTAILVVASGVAVTALAVLSSRILGSEARKGFLLALAAGIMYGVTAGLIKIVTTHGEALPGSVLRHWSFWVCVAAGLGAVALSQRAYHTARLSITVPVLNIVEVLVAVTFGAVVFRDRLFTTPVELMVELVGVTAMGLGVWQLSRQEERVRDD